MPYDSSLARALTNGTLEHQHGRTPTCPKRSPPELAGRLARDFTSFELSARSQRKGQKTYRFWTTSVDPTAPMPTPAWQTLIDTVASSRYRTELAKLTGLDLSDHELGRCHVDFGVG
ncbi:hypothetical protein ACFVY4_07335 [Streptomyces sp. NPDC058299]|uniref:hypothetical protein n=1 Tax=Streptomyces sp. NPDC058299 TaxID=3346435 RepID=UPI0036E5BACB